MNTGTDGSTVVEPEERDREEPEERDREADDSAIGERASERYEGTAIGVVVPAYNEAEHVGGVLEDIPSFVDRIYAVDDDSRDDTWAEIRRRASTDGDPRTDGGQTVDPRIVPLRHAENRGAGAALRTGYQRALAEDMDVTVAMDADGQMDPDQVPALVDPIVDGPADYAKGNRLADPEYREAMPPFRQFGNWLLTLLTKVASGYWKTMDPQNGFTAVSGEALEAIDLEALPDGHDYTNDLLVRLNVADLRVADVAMPAVYGEEESTITYSRFVPATSTTLLRSFLWRLRRRYLVRDFHPLAFSYGAGAASALGGLLLGVDALRHRQKEGGGTDSRAVGALLSLLFGCLFLLRAMVMDMHDNEDREVRRE
jgi:glycosyltransferase involved in cell wall biosynthesis